MLGSIVSLYCLSVKVVHGAKNTGIPRRGEVATKSSNSFQYREKI